jgi:hypothetical protein
VKGGWWLVVGGWWLVVGGWWLVVGGWWLVVGGYQLGAGHEFVICHLFRRLPDYSARSSIICSHPAFVWLLAIGYWLFSRDAGEA